LRRSARLKLLSPQTTRSSLLRRFFLGALYASAEFVNTIVAVEPMANPAFSHDVAYIAAVGFITGTAHKLSLLIIGHFKPSPRKHEFSEMNSM
jgi:hypothetical protein